MKKHLLLLMMVLLPMVASAYDVEIDGIYYDLNKETKTATVTYKSGDRWTGYNQNWNIATAKIPKSVEDEGVTYSVTSIGENAFNSCKKLNSITIPSSVTSIGDHAFHRCSGLKSVTIPNSVKSIDQYAFAGCSSLTSFSIPEGVTSIGENAFRACSSLTSIDIPEGVTHIGNEAFKDCSGVVHVDIPNTVTYIGGYAFDGTIWLFNQDDGVVYIGKMLYEYKGTMPENTKIIIKEGTVCICGSAFIECDNLVSVDIPNSVMTIGDWAFAGCSALTSLTIPNSVTTIGEGAFASSGLTSVTIPSSVSSIGGQAFYDCRALYSVNIEEGDTPLRFNRGEINLPAFDGAPLESVFLGRNISYDYSSISPFKEQRKLNSLTIGEDVTNIGQYDFSYCYIKSINILNLLSWYKASSSDYIFGGWDCQLYLNEKEIKELEIPESVTNIGNCAFVFCPNITSVKVHWNRPLAGGADSFVENVKKNATLYVPKGTATMYMSAPGWIEFANIVEYDEESAINRIETTSDANADWYTLDGRELEGEPAERGVYLYKGKKIYVK